MQELQALGDAVGTVSKGVPRAVVDALSRSRYSMPAPASGNQGGRRRSKGSRSPAAEPDKCGIPSCCLASACRGLLPQAIRVCLLPHGQPGDAVVHRVAWSQQLARLQDLSACRCTVNLHGKVVHSPVLRSAGGMRNTFMDWSSNVCRCAVCQMEYEDGDEVVTLPCTHFYHPDCIGQWLQDRKVRLVDSLC